MKQIKTKSKTSFVAKNKDILVVGGVLVVLAGAAVTYYLMTKKKEKKSTTANGTSLTTNSSVASNTSNYQTPPFVPLSSSSSSTKPVSTSSGKTIKIGSRGADVKILQRYLKIYKEDLGRTGPKRDGVDGIFGPKTARAAKKRLKKSVFTALDIAGMRKALKSLGK